MDPKVGFEQCLILRVGVVAKGSRCLSIMRMLDAIKPSRLRLKLVSIAPVTDSIACLKFAGESGIQICTDYQEMLTMDDLDLILEMTGNTKILADLVRDKLSTVGVLDRQASMLFFDIAHQYELTAEEESEISLTSSFASTLLEASPDGVMVIDRDYRIVKCNNSKLITKGAGREKVIGKYCFEVLHGLSNPCHGDQRVCPFQETLRTRRPARAMHEVTLPNGEKGVNQVIAFPLFNALGEIVQVVEIIRDMTRELGERVEQRAQAIKNDLTRVVQEDRLASLGRLVASVCHEINNPISSIVTFNKLILSYIRDQQLPPEGLPAFTQYLELSIKEALRCGDIVKHLLTFARQKNIESTDVNLVDTVKTIMLLTAHQLKMAGVDYKIEFSEAPLLAWGDYSLIQQCVMNLVFNAMDAMPDGGELTISGGRMDDSNKVWLSLADTGQGIDQKDLSRIFEPFYSTKPDGKGVGLGLSMVYGIIREHNGTIEVDSQPDKGTKFLIVLPTEAKISGNN